MINAGIYYIVKNKDYNFYYLQYSANKFEEPKKIYGDMLQRCIRVWNHYAISKKSTGCMFTGSAGSGKTKAGELLCNLAIDNGLPVIMGVELEYDIELIRFLSSLTDCVLFFDEFKKNINYDMENKMLTMLADESKRKLFILTENSIGDISSYIRDRPGRIRYHYDYDKISKAVFDDFCNDFNLTKEFKADLTDKYKDANVFTFDHLQAIVYEHLHYPDDSLENLLELLNLHRLKKKRSFKLVNITREPSWGEDVQFTERFKNSAEEEFKKYWVEHSITISKTEMKPFGENDKLVKVPVHYCSKDFHFEDLKRIDDTNTFLLEFQDPNDKDAKFKCEIVLE